MDTHRLIEPRILYFGTPVVLVSSLNPEGTTNLAPMSSVWALGDTLLLGLGADGQTFRNLERHPECVLNLPDSGMWRAIEALAPLTGSHPVPARKQEHFRHEADKFAAAGLAAQPSCRVRPARVRECPLQIEAVVESIHAIGRHDAKLGRGEGACAVEVRAVAVHAHGELMRGDQIDPGRWRPLIYNFRHYFGLGALLGRSFRSETPTPTSTDERPTCD